MLWVVILSATVQVESSKPGCASGDSSVCAQWSSAGSLIGAAVGTLPTRLPSPDGLAGTGAPFQVTFDPPLHTSIEPSVSTSPVSATIGPLAVAVRTRWVPRTRTGPDAVSCRQNVFAVAVSASR